MTTDAAPQHAEPARERRVPRSLAAPALGENPDRGQVVSIASDGATLSGAFTPAIGATRAGLVLHGATGVPHRYYRAFAEWAADQGIATLTYDYRDVGASQTAPMNRSAASFTDWILHDQAAAERRLAALVPDAPLWILGHSLGGFGFPFRAVTPRVTRIVTMGSGFTHFTDHPSRLLPSVLAFWFLLGPAATRLCGYLPGRRLMLGADLPAGVYWQWRRWCTRRAFFFSDVGHRLPEPRFSAKGREIRLVASLQDAIVPPPAVRRFAERFPAGEVAYRAISGPDYDLPAIGHIDVFAAKNQAAWPDILDLSAPS